MKILVFGGYYLPAFKGGGPIKTMKNLFETTGTKNIAYSLITSDRDLGDIEPFTSVKIDEWNIVGPVNVYYLGAGNTGTERIRTLIEKDDYDFIYINSFFSFRYSIYPQLLAKKHSKTVIVAPRGEFSQGALQLKSLKKRLFIHLYKLAQFHRRVIFQASSEYEAQDIKKTLGKGIDIKIAENIGAQEFTVRIPRREQTRTRIIFISRISPKKNLLQAIEMLQHVKSPTEYDIYGPIEDEDYWAKCHAATKRLPSNIQVRYKGSLKPEQVIDTIASYDIFFMPTLGENYGHVIAEAFCAGLPVLITDMTPWRQLEEKGIGWDISLNEPERFAKVIDEFGALTDEEYKEKRQHVLNWAKHKFSQSDAIEANIAMFNYVYEKSRKQ